MRGRRRILLWSLGGLVAACAVLVSAALIAMPRPSPEELARTSPAPAPPPGPGRG